MSVGKVLVAATSHDQMDLSGHRNGGWLEELWQWDATTAIRSSSLSRSYSARSAPCRGAPYEGLTITTGHVECVPVEHIVREAAEITGELYIGAVPGGSACCVSDPSHYSYWNMHS